MFNRPSKDEIESIKKKFPAGTRIVCNYCTDGYRPIDPGTKGTVRIVDDMGTVHCDFDNHRRFGLIPGEDSFDIIEEEVKQ